ncbi:unnamed protein product [Nippostrongylus brasiliensis]|uniref:Ovule protein n=1 Tax=Nippostrongylus brasiliensis TaxID=27835 RepID=A0A0N4YZM8_NIPBR|nr:hypothetical protein Q1695_015105 [Nippostrongylus brasiliensis]VDL87702.1 unnamed protein product [Nippostrongylus brasiliensis]
MTCFYLADDGTYLIMILAIIKTLKKQRNKLRQLTDSFRSKKKMVEQQKYLQVSLLLVMAMNVEVTRRRRSTSSEDEMYGGDQRRNEFLQAKNNGRAKDMSPSHGLNDQRMNNEKHRVPEEQK